MRLLKDYLYSMESGGGICSRTITLLRFPLAVFILLLHSSFEHELRDGVSIFEGWEAPLYHHIDFLFVQNVCNIAVPLFFLISGFLFFFKDDIFKYENYKNKLRKRVKSLLIPYLIWNVLVLMLYVVVQNLAPSMNSGRNKLIADYTLHDYVLSFWSMSFINEGGVSGPIDSPLWFIRDLMVMVFISPLIYWLIRKLDVLVPILLGMAYIIVADTGVQGFSMTALAFFSIGAYFGIVKLDFVKLSRAIIKFSSVIYSVILLFILIVMGYGYQSWLSRLAIIIGVFMVIGIASYLVDQYSCKINAFLTSSTFFIFASHSEILKIVIRLTSRLGVNSDLFYCVAYFVCPMITLAILLMLYRILLKFLPQLASVLSGGR